MENIKHIFKANEWELITFCLNNGFKQEITSTWIELGNKFNIFDKVEDKTNRQLTDIVRAIWVKFLRHANKNNLDLVVVKQTTDKNGDILSEIKKKDTVKQEYSLEDLKINKVTTNPYGGEWVTYVKEQKSEDNFELVIETLVNKLADKYLIDLKSKVVSPFVSQKKANETTQASAENLSKHIALVNLFDAHLDKIPIKSTCGVASTLEQNCEIFENIINKIKNILIGVKNLDYIIFPIGNDLFHTNGFNSQTKKGTQIEYFGSPEDSYYQICDVVTNAIKILASIANVKVIMVKGNHDEDKITVLGYWLERYFKEFNKVNKIFVQVDYLRTQRKYICFGKNLIGFAHGDKEKSKIAQLPLIMATEVKELWGKTTYRKMYLGDLHHGFEYQFLKAKDQPGVEIEYLRSVGTTDTWHEDFGWIGIPKTAYLQIFDENEGEVIRMKLNI